MLLDASTDSLDDTTLDVMHHIRICDMMQDSRRRPGASPGLGVLRQKLSEDLKALQELLLDT